MRRGGLLGLVVGLAALVTLGCRRPETARSRPGDGGFVGAPVVVEWAGCASVRRGPVCELGRDRHVTVWAGHQAATNWALRSDHGPLTVHNREAVDGGIRFTVEVPVASRSITLADFDGNPRWSLALADAKPHDEIDQLVARGRGGAYQAALEQLDALRARAPVGDRGPIDAAIGRMALALGKVDRAEPAFRSSIAAATADGRIGDVVRDGSALVWALVMLEQRFGDARALLDRMKLSGDQYPEGRVWIDYHAGLLAAHTGDVRTALEHDRAAERAGRRLGLQSLVENASMEVALLLASVGRSAEAVTALRALPPPADSCARASWALNLAWTLTERPRAPASDHPDAEVRDALAAAEHATEACPDPHRHLLSLVNSAEYALETDDDAEAARLVHAMETLPLERDVRLHSWRSDVFGRWSLHQNQFRAALAAFDDQTRAARGAGLLEEELRGEVGAGRALLALGSRRDGIARLRNAQKVLERMMREIPLGEGRGSFLGGHDDGVRTLVGALVDGGAALDAFQVAREARAAELVQAARIDRLSHLSPAARRRWDQALETYQRIRGELEHEAEDDWTIPREALEQLRGKRRERTEQAREALDDAYQLLVDERRDRQPAPLSNPASHELFIAFFPGPRGWYAMAATPARTVARKLDDSALASPESATKVLALFAPELAHADRVRLFPYGAADRIAWHALLWNGRPLAASLEVAYGLDVPTRNDPRATRDARTGAALIVANPTGDLPAAASEADLVAHALADWNVTRLDGAHATREALLGGLAQADLFHYAGHAEVVGAQGLSSALLLKGGARIELGDLLAAQSVPDFVVLSSCEAAGTPLAQPSLMGLAQGFIAAGSRAVVAPDRPISDTAARAFVNAFYPAFVRGGGSGSIASAYREAVGAVSGELRGPDDGGGGGAGAAADFRLLVP